ncbi:hypothetical protein BCR34DRAFT_521525 [Clohesyomyces aquaticus]|uniref:Homeobox domain-containing protein n=1 Tax=Clohesyomyces aquaticus TaxID=1231657 RepID=A0A1Y1YWG1_9PLEO|nr:hypothetical protein BCR34DRAFT_521525 [Clohesyomyces aquaticus]
MVEKGMEKGHAPSIWSFDSGYASHAGLDNQTDLDGDLRLEDFCIDAEPEIQSPHPLPTVHSVEPKLHVYTNLDPTPSSSSNAFLLPDIHNGLDVGGCLQCAFWDITNPGENLRCEECRRVPDIAVQVVEPGQLIVNGYKSKETVGLTSLDIRREETRVSTRCSACEFARLIDPTQKGTCGSCADKPKPISPSSPNPSLLSPISPRSPSAPSGKVRRSRAGRSSKLPLSALTRLQGWLDAHQDNPYPTAEDKRQLALDCGITEKQVTTWFTNARARQLNPLERWASSGSGSEDDGEGVREEDIKRAAGGVGIGNMSGLGLGSGLAESGFTYLSSNAPSSLVTTPYRRAASVSGSSAFSGGPGRAAVGAAPSRRGKKKDYRRSNAPQSPLNEFGSLSPISPISPIREQQQTSHPTPLQPESSNRAPLQPDQETWQCTFCLRPLVPKSWRRHEETQHRPRSQWTCMLYGPRLSFPTRTNTNPSSASTPGANENRNSTSYCAFCMLRSPPESHFQLHHRISECAKRAPKDRTYFRPDHLRQHVKNFHNSKLADSAQARWKNTTSKSGEGDGDEEKGWICGFCGDHLSTWDKRETHIANHFKDGWTMARWREWPQSQSDSETQDATPAAAQTQPNPQEDRGKRRQKEKSQSPESSFAKRLSRTLSFGRKSLSLSRGSQPSYTPRPSYDMDVDMAGTGAGASTSNGMAQGFITNSHNYTTAAQNSFMVAAPLLTTNINTEPLWSECDFNNMNMNMNMTNLWDLETPIPTSSRCQNQQYMPLTTVSGGDLSMDLGVGIYEQDLGLQEGFDLADWKTGNLGNRVDYQGPWK